MNVYPDRFEAFFKVGSQRTRDVSFRIAADVYAAGTYDIDFVDEHPGPYDDENEGLVTEYKPGCTPCQWVALSGAFHLVLSEIDDGDANTWRYSIEGKDVVIAPRKSASSVDTEAAEPLHETIAGSGEAYFYIIPPRKFSPTDIDNVDLPTADARVQQGVFEEEGQRVQILATESSSLVAEKLDGWDIWMEVPQELVSVAGETAVASSDDEIVIHATFTENAAGWQRHFELASGTLVVETAAKEIGDELTLRIRDADFIDVGDEYLAASALHVTFGSISLKATLKDSF